MTSLLKKISIISLVLLSFSFFSGCQNNKSVELTSAQQAMLDIIWSNKSTWQKVESGFDYVDCNSIEFGEYNGKTVFVSRHVGAKSQFTGASLLRQDCYYVTENSFKRMYSWDEIRYEVGFLYSSAWSSTSTETDLKKIYIQYLNNKS